MKEKHAPPDAPFFRYIHFSKSTYRSAGVKKEDRILVFLRGYAVVHVVTVFPAGGIDFLLVLEGAHRTILHGYSADTN